MAMKSQIDLVCDDQSVTRDNIPIESTVMRWTSGYRTGEGLRSLSCINRSLNGDEVSYQRSMSLSGRLTICMPIESTAKSYASLRMYKRFLIMTTRHVLEHPWCERSVEMDMVNGGTEGEECGYIDVERVRDAAREIVLFGLTRHRFLEVHEAAVDDAAVPRHGKNCLPGVWSAEHKVVLRMTRAEQRERRGLEQ